MATKLDKNIVRESTVQIDDRDVMVTLTADQEVSFKLKGMKSGEVKISIRELYNQLTGIDGDSPRERKSVTISNQPKKSTKGNPMISLFDLRSRSAITSLDYDEKAKFDRIINKLIKEIR